MTLGALYGTFSVVAESRFFAQKPAGVRAPVHVQVFLPRKAKSYAACRVHMHGLEKPCTIYGEDTMQALALAVRFINNTLAVLHAAGWRYFYAREDGRPFNVWTVWGHLPRLSTFQSPTAVPRPNSSLKSRRSSSAA
jgi:hypothetical protein